MGGDQNSSEFSSPGIWGLDGDKLLSQRRTLAHTGSSVSGEL